MTTPEPRGKMLPDAPGVWFYEGKPRLVSRHPDSGDLIAQWPGDSGRGVHTCYILPTGGWLSASPPLSDDERSELERLRAENANLQSELVKDRAALGGERTDLKLIRSAVGELLERAANAETERDKYKQALCHATFALWGQGDHKVQAAEADLIRCMRELGIDWNGEQVAAPQAEKPQ